MIKLNEIFHTKQDGTIRVIEYKSVNKILVEFINTGTRLWTYAQSIRKGCVRDPYKPRICGVGFMGQGEYKAKVNYKTTKPYKLWEGMLYRCYAHDQATQNPSYIGVTVCEEWHCFQNFAKWWDTHYPTDGKKYDLDKDKRGISCKEYSPDSCSFITRKENAQLAHQKKMKSFKVISPNGEMFEGLNQHEFCRQHSLVQSNFHKMLHGKIKSHLGWKLSNE